ncbi:MAG: HpcH/HpaI aldolase/citrate lyase family protein [Candidatus Hodarchaeota archaeon]
MASIGSWITLNNPSIAEIMADAGFDWLCVDMEHSVTDYYEAQMLISLIQAKGLKAYVRVGENNTRIIKRVLDAGADGIIVPSVNSSEEAAKAVKSAKYPPVGERGVGLARAQGYGFDFENYKNSKVSGIKVIAQIEHVNAINSLKEIIETDGIDGTFIGPYDLSGSMGKPGRFEDPDVKDVLDEYETIAKKYDKLIGVHVVEPSWEKAIEKIKKGYDFIGFSLDSIFLGTICRSSLDKIKKEIK